MDKHKLIKTKWNGAEIICHYFNNEINICNDKNLLLKELEASAKKIVDEEHVVTSIFQSALKTALRDAPLAYLMNEEYKAFLIEDYRKVLNEILGLDFDYEIKNNNYETVS